MEKSIGGHVLFALMMKEPNKGLLNFGEGGAVFIPTIKC